MRLIDADALLEHQVEADKMGAMLVVGKGFIMDAPTITPQPDPDTGIVPCGCGGKTETHELYGDFRGTYMTDCKKCATGTTQYNTKKEAQDAWNTAMGWKGGAE